MASRHRRATQAALWILFAGGAAIVVVGAPMNALFKLWSVTSAAFSIALLGGLPDEPRFRRLADGFGALLGATVAVAGFQFLDHPLLPLCALALSAAVLLGVRAPGAPRAAALAAAVLVAALGLAELVQVALLARDEVVTELVDRASGRRTRVATFAVPDAVRGFAGRPNAVVHVSFRRSGGSVFDAIYTLDAHGRRETPGVAAGSPNVVFLGDSFAFGEGVDDGDSTAAQLVARAPRYRPLNLAFKAYGPHQALATLEAGLEQDALPPGAFAAGVYYAAFDPSRAAGRAFWDSTGPRYVLAGDGTPVRRGRFSDDRVLRVVALINRSYLLRELTRNRLGGDGDLELLVALVARTGELFRERHGGPFVAILSGGAGDARCPEAVARLRARGVDARTLREVVPELESSRARFELADGHPNREGHARVAAFLDALLAEASP